MEAKEWNQLVAEHPPLFGAFLQSWEWGEFQRALGFAVVRVFEEEKKKVLIAQAIEMTLPLGLTYWYVPKGPLGNVVDEEDFELLKKRLPKGAFVKIEPNVAPLGLTRGHDRQPSVTTTLDLTQSYDKLLEAMKPKTRYNIRLAEKKGVVCRIVGLDAFDAFGQLMEQTAERDQFSLHELKRYKKMLELLTTDDCRAFLAMAFYEDRPLAANIMIDCFGVRTYLHGASSNLYRNVMAPYALHDFLINDAQKKGLKTYDFWGIAPPEAGEGHPWAGISRFKLGFGGDVIVMPGTFDLAKNILGYGLYSAVKKFRG